MQHGRIDVRPHPHIGLGTVTYLYEGAFEHRDSTGAKQTVQPGEVNWMLAGRGVTHSERTGEAVRARPHSLFGVQTWVALPEDREDLPADFEHHKKDALPYLQDTGASVRLILGTAWGEAAPVTMQSEIFYADVTLDPNAAFPLPDNHEDRGIYVMQGSVEISGQLFETGQMMIFRPGDLLSVKAGPIGARLIALGGATLNGPRHIWWNFVSSDPEKIEQAKQDWYAADWGKGLFDLPVGDGGEFIPLSDGQMRHKLKTY